MTTKTTTKPRAKAKLANAQGAVKAVYEKGAAAFGEAKAFTEGNVGAMIESGKILGAGLKQLGEGYVGEGRSAFATLNADLKELTAARSPAEFFALQSKIVGRNFGSALDFYSKNAEAVLNLAKDSTRPLSRRVGTAIDTVRKAA